MVAGRWTPVAAAVPTGAVTFRHLLNTGPRPPTWRGPFGLAHPNHPSRFTKLAQQAPALHCAARRSTSRIPSALQCTTPSCSAMSERLYRATTGVPAWARLLPVRPDSSRRIRQPRDSPVWDRSCTLFSSNSTRSHSQNTPRTREAEQGNARLPAPCASLHPYATRVALDTAASTKI